MEIWYDVVTRMQARIERLAPEFAEDLYANCLSACSAKENAYDWSDSRIDGRVLRIAQNIVATMRRRECRERRIQAEYGDRTQRRQRLDAHCSETVVTEPWLEDLLSILPVSQKEQSILRECVALGLSDTTVAERLDMTEKSLRSRKSRLLKRLRSDPDIADRVAQLTQKRF